MNKKNETPDICAEGTLHIGQERGVSSGYHLLELLV